MPREGPALAALYFEAKTHIEEHDKTKSTAEEIKFQAPQMPKQTSSFLQPPALNWKEETQAFENWKHIKLK